MDRIGELEGNIEFRVCLDDKSVHFRKFTDPEWTGTACFEANDVVERIEG